MTDIVRSTAGDRGRPLQGREHGRRPPSSRPSPTHWSDDPFPFVFGGDGASFALPSRVEPLAARGAGRDGRLGAATNSLSSCASPLIPVVDPARAGLDVRVARYAPSPNVSYAMFTGGGLAFAERRMKAGAFAVPPGTAGRAAGPVRPVLPLRRDPGRARRHPVR